MKIAVIHEWLVTFAGSERVLEQILNLFPDADLYTLVDFLKPEDRRHVLGKTARTSFIQNLPFARSKYRSYLPIMPFAIERFDLSGYDLILSSSHAVAKGVRTRPGQVHICYCHTPMRYAWDLREQYLKESGIDRGIKGALARTLLGRIRSWDAATASRVDHFIANSRYIAERIKRSYDRDSAVIYPPVDVDAYTLCESKEDFYLAASRMVPYKKIDLIVEAFSGMPDKRLIVIGDGPDHAKIAAKAGPNVRFLGQQPFPVLKDHLQKAKAFVFAAEEDFGILPVEAQACGTPVIAFGRGGALETVIPLRNADCGMRIEGQAKPTGVFFEEQTVESLQNAVRLFEQNRAKFDGHQIRGNAIRFSIGRFKQEYNAFVQAHSTFLARRSSDR